MSEQDVAGYVITRLGLELLDSVIDVAGKLAGAGDEERNRAIIACSIPYLKFMSEDGKATRPIAFLDKYLNGGGEAEKIDLFTLLAEDKGVRASIHRQITSVLAQQQFFRATQVDISKSGRLSNAKAMGVADNPNAYRQKLAAFQSRELLLDVAQDDFQLQDWRNAIGAFNVSWSLVDIGCDNQSAFAKIWGTNVYRWHPELPRKSQLVHQAAERMKAFGAMEFDMVFRPCLISVATGDATRL